MLEINHEWGKSGQVGVSRWESGAMHCNEALEEMSTKGALEHGARVASGAACGWARCSQRTFGAFMSSSGPVGIKIERQPVYSYQARMVPSVEERATDGTWVDLRWMASTSGITNSAWAPGRTLSVVRGTAEFGWALLLCSHPMYIQDSSPLSALRAVN